MMALQVAREATNASHSLWVFRFVEDTVLRTIFKIAEYHSQCFSYKIHSASVLFFWKWPAKLTQ